MQNEGKKQIAMGKMNCIWLDKIFELEGNMRQSQSALSDAIDADPTEGEKFPIKSSQHSWNS